MLLAGVIVVAVVFVGLVVMTTVCVAVVLVVFREFFINSIVGGEQ